MRFLASVDLQYWRIFGKIILMKTNILLLLGAATAVGCGSLFADELCAKAELAGNEIRLYAKPLAYEVLRDGDVLVSKTKIGMKLDGKCASGDCCKSEAKCAGVAKPVVTVSSEASTIKTAVYKKSYIDGSKVEAFADFGDWGVRLVARKDGVAYARSWRDYDAVVQLDKVPAGVQIGFQRDAFGGITWDELPAEEEWFRRG